MSNSYRYVRLLKNHLYPTYQLHAYMANDKTDPKDGLRLAALITLHWLKSRLGDAAPAEWNDVPSPENYLIATDDDLPSLYLNQGFVINIVSLPDKGMWALQITEPDLGSDPGNPKQTRQPVPGRIIETNVAFQIVGKQLECGFKTVISDPEGTSPEAEVYRTTVVRLLMEHPAFGLKQVTEIPMKPIRLTNNSQVKTMLWVTHHAENQMPTVIFTQPEERREIKTAAPDLNKLQMMKAFPAANLNLDNLNLNLAKPKQMPNTTTKVEFVPVDPAYDLEKFTYYTFSHCRTYILEQAASKGFTDQSGIKFKPGDIIVLYTSSMGGGERVIPYHKPDDPWDDSIQAVEKGVKDSLKGRDMDFGHIIFLTGAREHLLRLSDELMAEAETADAHFQAEIEQMNASWKNEIAKKNSELEAAAVRLQRQKEYTSQLEYEKSKLREDFALEKERMQDEINTHLATIEFLKRRYDQPANYDGIEKWVKEHFSDRLILHPKAISRMMTKANQCAAVELVCDALDFLATDYWDMHYLQVSKDIMLTHCSEKYGRPFEVTHVGQTTIDFTPGEYRIKYFRDAQGRECDSDLDYHLRVGNDSENLLRIYFLHDDAEKKIVIGSLPDHLRSVKIQ